MTYRNKDSILFTPLTVRNWTLKNRIVVPPMVTVRNIVHEDGISWYGRLAQGGAGLVIIEATGIPRFGNDLTPATLRPVIEAIHTAGALAAIQLFPITIGEDREVDALSQDDINEIIAQFRVATRVCLEAGMDGVEPHGAHGYLINRFFSPADNPRTDEYGADTLENRMRLGLQIVETVKEEAGDDMLLLYRHTPVKDGSYSLAESIEFAARLVSAGVDILDISPSSIEAPGDRAQPFRQFGIPVITVGKLDMPGRAAEALREERADLAAVARGSIADPDWPKKVAAGRWNDITVCTKCNAKCFGNLKNRFPIGCSEWQGAGPFA